MTSISIFDIIKVGIGPSSSHTMGPWKAASLFLNSIKDEIQKVQSLDIFLYGSLAKTGKGHGTDVAILMGFSGEKYTQIKPEDIPFKLENIKKSKTIFLANTKEINFTEQENIHYLIEEDQYLSLNE